MRPAMTDTARDTAMPAEIAKLVERLAQRAATMNGAVVGASDRATYTLGYYDQFAAADDKEAAAALEAQAAELAEARADALKVGDQMLAEKFRADRAEAALAEARKVLDALDRMSRGLDWCDKYEQARRWSAARRALTGGEL